MTRKIGTKSSSAAIEQAFGRVIQELRRERGLSQEQLGFESDLHRTYISLLERGKKSPTLATLLQLASALETRASEIVRKVEERIEQSEVCRRSREGEHEDHSS